LQPPKTLPHHFENLMLSIATLYKNDKQGLGLEFLGIQPIEGNLMFSRTPVAQVLQFIFTLNRLLSIMYFYCF
jgi:hypothetical protein